MSDFKYVSFEDGKIAVQKEIVTCLNYCLRGMNRYNFGPGDAHLVAMSLATMLNDRFPLNDEGAASIRKIALQLTKEDKTDD